MENPATSSPFSSCPSSPDLEPCQCKCLLSSRSPSSPSSSSSSSSSYSPPFSQPSLPQHPSGKSLAGLPALPCDSFDDPYSTPGEEELHDVHDLALRTTVMNPITSSTIIGTVEPAPEECPADFDWDRSDAPAGQAPLEEPADSKPCGPKRSSIRNFPPLSPSSAEFALLSVDEPSHKRELRKPREPHPDWHPAEVEDSYGDDEIIVNLSFPEWMNTLDPEVRAKSQTEFMTLFKLELKRTNNNVAAALDKLAALSPVDLAKETDSPEFWSHYSHDIDDVEAASPGRITRRRSSSDISSLSEESSDEPETPACAAIHLFRLKYKAQERATERRMRRMRRGASVNVLDSVLPKRDPLNRPQNRNPIAFGPIDPDSIVCSFEDQYTDVSGGKHRRIPFLTSDKINQLAQSIRSQMEQDTPTREIDEAQPTERNLVQQATSPMVDDLAQRSPAKTDSLDNNAQLKQRLADLEQENRSLREALANANREQRLLSSNIEAVQNDRLTAVKKLDERTKTLQKQTDELHRLGEDITDMRMTVTTNTEECVPCNYYRRRLRRAYEDLGRPDLTAAHIENYEPKPYCPPPGFKDVPLRSMEQDFYTRVADEINKCDWRDPKHKPLGHLMLGALQEAYRQVLPADMESIADSIINMHDTARTSYHQSLELIKEEMDKTTGALARVAEEKKKVKALEDQLMDANIMPITKPYSTKRRFSDPIPFVRHNDLPSSVAPPSSHPAFSIPSHHAYDTLAGEINTLETELAMEKKKNEFLEQQLKEASVEESSFSCRPSETPLSVIHYIESLETELNAEKRMVKDLEEQLADAEAYMGTSYSSHDGSDLPHPTRDALLVLETELKAEKRMVQTVTAEKNALAEDIELLASQRDTLETQLNDALKRLDNDSDTTTVSSTTTTDHSFSCDSQELTQLRLEGSRQEKQLHKGVANHPDLIRANAMQGYFESRLKVKDEEITNLAIANGKLSQDLEQRIEESRRGKVAASKAAELQESVAQLEAKVKQLHERLKRERYRAEKATRAKVKEEIRALEATAAQLQQRNLEYMALAAFATGETVRYENPLKQAPTGIIKHQVERIAACRNRRSRINAALAEASEYLEGSSALSSMLMLTPPGSDDGEDWDSLEEIEM